MSLMKPFDAPSGTVWSYANTVYTDIIFVVLDGFTTSPKEVSLPLRRCFFISGGYMDGMVSSIHKESPLNQNSVRLA